MAGVSPDVQPMLTEYRHQLAWARARLEELPPPYREVIDASIAKCEAAVALIEQATAQARGDPQGRRHRVAPRARQRLER